MSGLAAKRILGARNCGTSRHPARTTTYAPVVLLDVAA